MKRLLMCVVVAMLLTTGWALAQEMNDIPEAGTGWLNVQIHDEPVSFLYTGSTASMTGTIHTFKSEEYTMSIMFDKKLEVGIAAGKNSIQQIEIISSNRTTSGYYFTKKSSDTEVDSEVLLEQQTEDGLYQGTFRVTVSPGNRWVGDLQPGIIAQLELKDGAFCFRE